MALSDPYIDAPTLKLAVNERQDTYDDLFDFAVEAASRGIEGVCERVFNDAGTTSARMYDADGSGVLEVDDFNTPIGLVVRVDSAGDGSFATTVDVTGFQLRPLNGIVSGQPGWPFCELWDRSRSSSTFHSGDLVEVTARWGWTAVPVGVKSACLIVAEEIYKLKDTTSGGDAAVYGVMRVRENPAAMRLLGQYMKNPVMVA